MPCCTHAIPLPCHAALIHKCHASPLPFSDSAVFFVKVCVIAGNIRTASPTVSQISMLLIINFVEICMVAGRSRTRAGRPHALSGWPMLIHTNHAMLMPHRGLEKSLSEWHGRGTACVNQTWPRCVNQMRKTPSKPLAEWNGRGIAREWHGICELALKGSWLQTIRNTKEMFCDSEMCQACSVTIFSGR
jgi:hypothetical protein